jgi:hypothetical protein
MHNDHRIPILTKSLEKLCNSEVVDLDWNLKATLEDAGAASKHPPQSFVSQCNI